MHVTALYGDASIKCIYHFMTYNSGEHYQPSVLLEFTGLLCGSSLAGNRRCRQQAVPFWFLMHMSAELPTISRRLRRALPAVFYVCNAQVYRINKMHVSLMDTSKPARSVTCL